jgi:hypothetical protein
VTALRPESVSLKVLVCGLHRSGTSAMAHHLAAGAGWDLLDDPEWAIEEGAASFLQNDASYAELARADIAKIPRMTEALPAFLEAFRGARVVVMVRDPRDTWCSIREKFATGRKTRMHEYSRIGVHERGALGCRMAFDVYMERAQAAADAEPDRVLFVPYEYFYEDRVTVAGQVAAWLDVPFDVDGARRVSGSQLAPLRNKPEDDHGIRGPGRWQRDLPQDELAVFEPAAATHDRITRAALDRLARLAGARRDAA